MCLNNLRFHKDSGRNPGCSDSEPSKDYCGSEPIQNLAVEVVEKSSFFLFLLYFMSSVQVLEFIKCRARRYRVINFDCVLKKCLKKY